MEDIKGIYKFTNKINKKSYIGQSNRLEERYKQHKRSFLNENHHSYNTAFYRALRKYGFDSFEYEILIQSDAFTREELNKLEIKYIDDYNTFGNGYNMNKGGNFTSTTKTLIEEDIIEIKNLLKNTNNSYTNIAKQFNVSVSLISMINSGAVWNYDEVEKFPLRERDELALNKGSNNPNAKITDDKAMELRKAFMSSTLKEVYSKNSELLSLSGMKKLLYGETFNHLPIYKKREKKWFLNGTCIDYPRLEE